MTRSGATVAAVVALAYALLLLGRGHPYDVDRVTQFLPYAHATGEALAQGGPPLWTSAIWSGFPLFAEGQSGALSPLQVVWLVAGDAVAALDLLLLLTLTLAALAGAWAARLLGATAAGSAVSGISWALGGFLLAYQDNPAVLLTCLALPLVWALALRGRALALALVLAFAILGGHPYFYALAVALGALGWVLGAPPSRGHLLAGAGAIGLALLLGAVQWAPSLELVLQSGRADGMSSGLRNTAALEPGDLLYLVSPLYSPNLRYSSGSGVLAYQGVFVLVLAGAGAALWKGHARKLALLGSVALVVALVASTAGGASALERVPLLRLLRGPSKLLVVVTLAISLLAGLGVSRLKGCWGPWIVVAVIALDLIAYGQRKADPVDRDALRQVPRVAEAAGPGARLRDLQTQSTWGRDVVRAEDPAAFMREHQPLDANCAVRAGLTHVNGYTPVSVARSERFMTGASVTRLKRAATTHVVLPPPPHVPAPAGLEPVTQSRRWALYAVPGTLPRAYACGRAVVAGSLEEALAAVDREPLDTVVLEEADVRESVRDSLTGQPTGDVTVVAWNPGRIALRTSFDRPAVVVVADSFYPGWVAEVDGERTPVFAANVAFKGVLVPSGDHRVVLAYRPVPFAVGLWASATTAFAFFAAFAVGIIRLPNFVGEGFLPSRGDEIAGGDKPLPYIQQPSG